MEMKVRRNTPPHDTNPLSYRIALEISPHKKMLKMKSALDELLKTKGQNECSG